MSKPLFLAVLLGVVVASPRALAAPSNVTVNGATTYQTIDGFGAAINAHSWDAGAAASALDQLDMMGVKTWRVVYEMTDWEATNDDADPTKFNWTSYNALFASPNFEELWSTIAYLNRKGYTSSVILNFMGRVPPWMGGATLNTSLKDEFVETVVAVAYYGRVTRGLQFGQFEPLNESDWDGFEGAQVGASDYADVMNRIAVRLDALGLSSLKLVGPDCAQSSVGLGSYLPAMADYPALMAHVDALTIHQYSASSAGLMTAIAATRKHGWVSETDSILNAWAQVSEGVNDVLLWEGFDSVYNHAILAGRGSTAPNDSGQKMGLANAPLAYSSAGGGTYSRRGEYYQWEQLFRFVAPGALRIEASTSANGIHALAFRHPTTGRVTIVGRNDNASAQTLRFSLANVGSLSALNAYATNQELAFSQLNDVAVVDGVATFIAPYNSIFTLTTAAPTNPVPLPSWAVWLASGLLLGAGALALHARRDAAAT